MALDVAFRLLARDQVDNNWTAQRAEWCKMYETLDLLAMIYFVQVNVKHCALPARFTHAPTTICL